MENNIKLIEVARANMNCQLSAIKLAMFVKRVKKALMLFLTILAISASLALAKTSCDIIADVFPELLSITKWYHTFKVSAIFGGLFICVFHGAHLLMQSFANWCKSITEKMIHMAESNFVFLYNHRQVKKSEAQRLISLMPEIHPMLLESCKTGYIIDTHLNVVYLLKAPKNQQ